MSKPKIGDVIEITTNIGLAYAQYTHYKPKYGAILRVFDETFIYRPSQFDRVVQGAIRFTTIFPLDAAIRQSIFEVVSNEAIRSELKEFPVFRGGTIDPETKKVRVWWLWDGENSKKVGELSNDQLSLPIRGILNDTLLIERIEAGWRPETDYRN